MESAGQLVTAVICISIIGGTVVLLAVGVSANRWRRRRMSEMQTDSEEW